MTKWYRGMYKKYLNVINILSIINVINGDRNGEFNIINTKRNENGNGKISGDKLVGSGKRGNKKEDYHLERNG